MLIWHDRLEADAGPHADRRPIDPEPQAPVGRRSEGLAAPAATWFLADVATASSFPRRARVDPRLRRAARDQLLRQHEGDAADLACAGSLQPLLPAAGDRRPREADHLEGDGDPGHVQGE